MADTYVKVGGAWNTVKELFVKDTGTWRPINTAWQKVGGVWQVIFGGNSGSIPFTTMGAFSFTVPAGVTSISVKYPTTTGIVTTILSVTAGQVLTGNIGDYGSSSTFSTITTPVYSKDIVNWAGNVDSQNYSVFGIVSNSYSVYGEISHGALGHSVSWTGAIVESTIVGNIRAEVFNSTGRYNVTQVVTQPIISNSYQATVLLQDAYNSEGYYTFSLRVTQQVPFTISYNRYVTYTPGAYTYTVPTGVYSINITALGGGGGGAYADPSGGGHWGTGSSGGGGGGGGLVTSTNIAVTPGNTYSLVVGAGGYSGGAPTNPYYATSASAGGSTTITGTGVSISAGGGGGGQGGNSGAYASNAGGVGGTAAGGVNTPGSAGGYGNYVYSGQPEDSHGGSPNGHAGGIGQGAAGGNGGAGSITITNN